MSEAFDSETASLMADALRQALARLKMLGLVDGDADVATKHLSRLIMHAVQDGERDEENLVLFAMGRFQSARTGAERKP